MNTSTTRATTRVVFLLALVVVLLAIPVVVHADEIQNNLGATSGIMTLITGGANGSTTLVVVPTSGDGKQGCNLTGHTTLVVSVNSSDTSIATVSPTSITFGSCGDTPTITVTPHNLGTAGVTLTQVSNSTGGTFDLATAAFTVKVVPPPNTPPTVSVTGVTAGAMYEFGSVPTAGCLVSDTEDGLTNSTTAATLTLSPITGPLSSYGLGAQTTTCSYTDTGGLTTSAQADYSINDTTPPTIDSHPDVGPVEATSANGATVNYTSPATHDAVAGTGTATCSPVSGSTFAIGDTTVTCNATDEAGNSATPTTFVVHVVDSTAPVIAAHTDVTAEAMSAAGAIVTYISPATSDAVDGAGTATCAPASGTQFALGDTTVTCNATDAHGNAATPTTFVVHVVDTTPPTITGAPTDIIAEATSAAGAAVSYTSPTASDIVDGPITPSCVPASGSTFALGTTTVQCTATDAHGNSAHSSFTVTVQDTTPPTIDAHSDETTEATSSAGAVVNYTSPATHDAVDGTGTASCSPASGSTFALGATTVTCNATDSHGNAAAPTAFKVTVQDTTPPDVTVPADITAEATGPTGAVVTFSASATDLVDGAITPTCAPASGSTFALGTTTVDCSATDAHHNTASKSFNVKVQDTTPPTIDPSADVGPIEATSSAGAVASYTSPATHDAVDGTGTATCSPASGSTFSLGDTTVTCNATDVAGNHATPTNFTVKVRDTTPPTLTVPADIIAEATGPSGAAVSFTASATDLVDPSPSVTCSPASGSTFALGATTVSCTAKDASGNVSAVKTFKVTVQDTTPPSVSVPADITAEATGPSGAAVSYSGDSATDLVDGSITPTCAPASGSTFALGTTTVTCSATDGHGNTGTNSFKVTVQDTTPPTISGTPSDIGPIEATGPSGAVVTYTDPTATDIVDGTDAVTCSPASGSTFALGDTTVTCNAADAHGNHSTPTTFTVKVQDTTPPTLTVPGDITKEATGPNGATVNFIASATDLVDPHPTVTCSPDSGSTFPLGTSTVSCTAKDRSNNTSAPQTFRVTVQDTTPPTVSSPADITAEATGPSGAVVTYTGQSANDLVDGSVAVSCSPASGSTFPIATTTVTCTASDNRGNTGSKTFKITVQDTTPPTVTPPADITTGPTNGTGAIVTYSGASATDIVDGPFTPTCTPASSSQFGFGTTTVTCSATDSHHNTGSATFKVTVTGFTFIGFLAPVNNPNTVNTGKATRTYPVKWQLTGANGSYIGDLSAIKSVTYKSTACNNFTNDPTDGLETSSTGNTSLRYDSTANQFVYNWATPDVGCYSLFVTLSDGSVAHQAWFNLTK